MFSNSYTANILVKDSQLKLVQHKHACYTRFMGAALIYHSFFPHNTLTLRMWCRILNGNMCYKFVVK